MHAIAVRHAERNAMTLCHRGRRRGRRGRYDRGIGRGRRRAGRRRLTRNGMFARNRRVRIVGIAAEFHGRNNRHGGAHAASATWHFEHYWSPSNGYAELSFATRVPVCVLWIPTCLALAALRPPCPELQRIGNTLLLLQCGLHRNYTPAAHALMQRSCILSMRN